MYLRCYSGTMQAKASLSNVTRGLTERPAKILRVMASDYEEVDEVRSTFTPCF